MKDRLLAATPPTTTTTTAGPRGQPKKPKYHALYVLYFAGHGTYDKPDPQGDLVMEKGEVVTLEDLLKAWAESAPYRAGGGSRLLIVADSCFSGKLAERLRSICTRPGQRGTREAAAARTVAVQASCSATETAFDGTFTNLFVQEASKISEIWGLPLGRQGLGLASLRAPSTQRHSWSRYGYN